MRTDVQFKIRIPPELKQWLEREAERNLRSVTAEIVLSVRERKERQTKTAPESAGTLAEA